MRNGIYRNVSNVIIIILQILALIELLKGDYVQALLTMFLMFISLTRNIAMNRDTIRRTKVLEYARGKTD